MAYKRKLPPPTVEGENTYSFSVSKPTEDDDHVCIFFEKLTGSGTLRINDRLCTSFEGGSLLYEIGSLLTEDENTVTVSTEGDLQGNVYLRATNYLTVRSNAVRLTDEGLEIETGLNVSAIGNYVFEYVLSDDSGLLMKKSFTEKLTGSCKQVRHILTPEPIPQSVDLRLTISRLGVGCDTVVRHNVPCRRTCKDRRIDLGTAVPDDETLALIADLGAELNEDTPVTRILPDAEDGVLCSYLRGEKIVDAAAKARCDGDTICFTLACNAADEDGLIENGIKRPEFGMLKKIWSEQAACTFVPSLFAAAGSLMFFPVYSFGNPKGTGITVELSDTEGKILQKQTFSSEKPEPHQVGVFAAQLPGDKPLLILKTSINSTDYSLKRLIYTGKGSILSEDITNELLQILTTE